MILFEERIKADSYIIRGLDLAETELIFPTAALTVLCFVWEARKVLITHQHWLLLCSACAASRLPLQHAPRTSRMGVDKTLGEDTARRADPN